MCGIAGLFTDRDLTEQELLGRARSMSDRLVHRGPDDSGSYVDADAGIALGFRRLAILDLSSTGHQPMCSSEGRFLIVFNGEIYNYRALRDELLDGGWSFHGTSDTEVLANALERWGVERTLRRLNGMFSFAAWEQTTRTLWLARDRLGIKPLYVFRAPGFVAFSSELKGLLALPEVDPKLDHDSVASYLRHLYVPAPRSILQGIEKLPPAHAARIASPSETPEDPRPFWRLDRVARAGRSSTIDQVPEAKRELDRLLLDAAGTRLQADVPVGALLSGGIDSSLAVAAMRERASGPVKTFTIGFDVEEHDETAPARAVAEHLETDHHELRLSGDDALAVVPDLATMFDEPFADPSQIPTFLVSRLARQEVTVALSGDGGDELFGGYNRYLYGPRAIGMAQAMPGPVSAAASALVSALPSDRWDRVHRRIGGWFSTSLPERLVGEKLHKLARVAKESDETGRYRALLSAWTDPEEVLLRGQEPRDHIDRVFEEHASWPLVERMMLADQTQYLPDDLLAKVDRASMAVSLEVRVPLLDHRIVEFSWRLPHSMKIRDGSGKWILRELLADRLPRHLFERPKVGFTVPIAHWLRGPLRAWADDLLAPSDLAGDGLLDAGAVRDTWLRFLNGHSQLALSIWAVLMLQSWTRRWT